ncbi:hypothetical protein BDZ90DRAFT_233251 [Jaminaea rosea]|uniref:Uncharacterized protein n=1 Tax=Jaminaea rosea TaxID=1569628 RepID=A0A316UMX6_9BASI|nr:hypothetical protein BDZ90DRAFT_233251 [Jaminaea rosea]PWN26637.1 hypothetical protein BDZ90DRAFT_233251 [Jaminaea rosea]
MGQVCNQAPNAHCIYTPPAEGLFQRRAPAVHVDRGSLLSQEPDAIGSSELSPQFSDSSTDSLSTCPTSFARSPAQSPTSSTTRLAARSCSTVQ